MHARILFVVWMLSEFRRCCLETGPFSEINYAEKKHAYQEPITLDPYTAERGVDGDTSWPYCTHTYGAYNLPSNWTVELGMWIRVTGITIYNRIGFNYRLQNFEIYGRSPLAIDDVIYNDTNKNTYGNDVIRLEMSQSRAYTAIQIGIPARDNPLQGKDQQNVLTLCEVQVYGVPGCDSPNLDSHVQIVSRPNESSIILTCESGYTPTENITLKCNDGSFWSGSQPKCSPIKCESPGEVDNGYYVVSNETMCDSHNITYLNYQCNIKTICNEGYYLRGQGERTCQADGKWTNVYPICDIVTCDFPGEISRGKYISGTSDYIPYVYGPMNYLTKIEVRCDTGYKIENSKERICESSGTWSGSDPQCSIVQCSSKTLEIIANGHYILNGESEFDADFANYNDTVGVVCMKGFKQDSDNLGTCGANGTWSNQPSSCTVVTCLTPIETSYVKYQTWYNTSYGIFTNELPYGASINATCSKGILKAGSRIRYCQENGSWDGENPICVSLCKAPELSNGILKDDNDTLIDMYEEGQYLSLTCWEGYESSYGGGNLTCQKNHSWSYLPSCLRIERPGSESSAQIAVVGGASGGSVAFIAILLLVIIIVIYKKRKGGQTGLLKGSARLQTQNTSEFAGILVTDTSEGKDHCSKIHKQTQSIDTAVDSNIVEYANTNEGKTNEDYYNVNSSHRMPEGAIRVENLSDIVLSGENALTKLTEQFKTFPDGMTEKHAEAIKAQNRGKNRYRNLYAYDETRVVLEKETSEESDYINACYIDGFQVSREYIASQGPTKDMIPDFWKMVWQTDSSKIVMLTKIFEEDKIKCVQYWPDSDSMEYGKITVTFEESEIYTDFIMRRLKMKKAGNPDRTVNHFHFTAWPDRGVPKHASSIVQFRNKVINTPSFGAGPMVVHCSAGVGRTGTFIGLDYLTKQGKKTGYVDVVGTVKALRKQRVNLVQTCEQYIFVHHALVETLMLSTSALPTSKFPDTYKDLMEIDRNNGKRKLDHEFQMLKTFSSVTEEGQYVSAKQVRNRNKNRYSNILPVEKFMPYLTSEHSREDEYINAVFLPSYKKTNAFIITQTPLETTKLDFWNLVWENNAHTIVMMNDMKEMQKSEIYWPDKGENISFGRINVSNDDVLENDSHKIVLMTLTSNSETRCIKQIQCAGWMSGKCLPKSPAVVLSLLELVQAWQQQTGNQPIVAHCMNGAEKSGLFCVISAVIERLKVEQDVAIAHIVGDMGRAREQIIPNVEQYQFVHETVLAFIQQNETYSNFSLVHGKETC